MRPDEKSVQPETTKHTTAHKTNDDEATATRKRRRDQWRCSDTRLNSTTTTSTTTTMSSSNSSLILSSKDAVIRQQVQSIQFGFYTDDDVRERSVLEVTSPVAFDPNANALPCGLYDARLGPVTARDPPCPTCCRRFADCPGHAAHLELAVPLHHPLLLDELLSALRSKCLACHGFRLPPRSCKTFSAKFRLLHDSGRSSSSSHDASNSPQALDDQLVSSMAAARQQCGDANKAAANRAAAASMDAILDDILSRPMPTASNTPTTATATNTTAPIVALQKLAIKQLKAADRCARCGAHSPKLRHDAHNKIFQKALSAKHAGANAAEDIQITSALVEQTDDNDAMDTLATTKTTNGESMDVDEETNADDDTDTATKRDTFMHTAEVQAQLERLWHKEPVLCQYLWGDYKKFFLQAIPVPPSRFRPPMHLNGMSVEHTQTQFLSKLLIQNATCRDRLAAGNNAPGAYAAWIELQTSLNCYMDSSKDPAGLNALQHGLRQVLEKKEGLFRKHMMGKRVNHACRSVISPDPYIGTSEIGLPRYFCETLTYPCPVNELNVAELRRLVQRGPHQYPGAKWVETTATTGGGGANNGTGARRTDLTKMNEHQRGAVAAQLLSRPNTVVGRQLRDGDYVLMNRQPTLHKPGIMAHRVRVLHNADQKTIRMHYANCNTYNADYDGDEMNCHFPQSDLARAEAQYIAQTDLQYIVPTDGSPLRGLIQDHVVGGVKMTKKDTFFEKWEYQQLLFAALTALPGLEIIRSSDNIEMVPPAVMRPRELWTGKQLVTTLLLHLAKGSDRDPAKLSNFKGLSTERKSKTPDTAFGSQQQEHLVLIRDGELLRGVLDKAAFGATDFSLVHAVYEAYGPEKAGLLLNALGRLFTAYIQYYAGHSCRMEDLVLTKKADQKRRELVERAYNLGARAAKAWADSEGGKVSIPPVRDQEGAEKPLKPVEAASAAQKIGLLLSGTEGKENFAALDGFMQGQLNPLASDIVKQSLPGGLAVQFPYNTFGIMTTTGAKGSIVNQSQVTCALGQQALEGRRVPRMSSGKTLPSFTPYDPNPRADGFVMDRFLTGIRPQEYYFHCMAGREGLVDTAVKTSRSGYLQRCLVKHLEELKIEYDYTVRNAEGNVVQFLYGEDGLDPTKASYLDCSDKSFEYMARNYDSLKRHNTALPSSTIDFALQDAKRHEALESGEKKSLAVGDSVLARRLRSGQEWVRGALCRGWSLATVKLVHENRKIVDIVYHSDGQLVKGVPIQVNLRGAGGNVTPALTSKTTIVKPCTLDPIISTASRGHRLGSSGACVSERLATAAATAMADGSKVGKAMASRKLSKRDLSSLISAKFSSSVCAPGEAVGSIAAQSVGEPSTQMTLNTFHLAGAGANVTLGIPRLREIIMTASRELKTPTMSVPLHESVTEKQAVRLARNYTKLSLMDLIAGKRGISITERLESDGAGGWLRAYYVVIKFHPAERIKEAFGISLHDIAKVVAKNYVPLLSQLMKKELKRSSVEADTGVGEVAGGGSTDYFQEGGDTTTGDTSKPVDDELNDDEDDADDVPGEEDGVEFGKKAAANYEEEGETMSVDGDESDSSDSPSAKPEQSATPEETINVKSSPTVQKKTNSIALQGLKVDPSVRPLLMVGLVEKAASTILVRSRKNIDQAFINDEIGRGRCLQTAGINFEELWKLDVVNHDGLMSNDIWAVRCSYGVEAARSSIMEQIRSVFGAYGIEVDPRHLSLIADYMTFDGNFKPMSRIGIEDSSSTLLQMSFETTGHFMKKAAMLGICDDLQSPSANIVVGRPIRHGTGAFALLAKT